MAVFPNPILSGTFTSNATSQLVNVPLDIIKFEIFNETYFGATTADTRCEGAFWIKDLAAGSAYRWNKTSGAATIALTNMVTTGGFTLIDPTAAQLQAVLTGTAVSQAAPASVTSAGTGTLVNNDIVRVYKVTGMQQIAGMDFSVSSVVANTSFSLTNIDSSAFGAAGTAISYQKLNYQDKYYPRRRFITNIGASGTSAIITMSVTHGFTVGQAVRIIVPTAFVSSGTNPFSATGTQASTAVPATITAINATDGSGFTNTITVNVNVSGFTFAFPTSATAASGVTFPQVVPVGEAATTAAGSTNAANLLDDATVNQGVGQMFMASSLLGANNDIYRWIAYRGYGQ